MLHEILHLSKPLVGFFIFFVLNRGDAVRKHLGLEEYFVLEVRRGNPDLWLWLGDNAYSDGTSMNHKRNK